MRKPGRPLRDPFDRIRVLVWYYELNIEKVAPNPATPSLAKAKLKFSDHSLNKKFDPRIGIVDFRLSTFHRIRKLGTVPNQTTKKSLRGIDLITRVDNDPIFKGSAKIYHSPFWELIQNKDLKIQDIRRMVVLCVINLKLQTNPVIADTNDSYGMKPLSLVEFTENITAVEELAFKRADAYHEYDQMMASVFNEQLASLDYIALIGLLGLEAIHAGNRLLGKYHFKTLEILIDWYAKAITTHRATCPKAVHISGDLGQALREFTMSRIARITKRPKLPGNTKRYSTALNVQSTVQGQSINLKSPILALLERHEMELWHT